MIHVYIVVMAFTIHTPDEKSTRRSTVVHARASSTSTSTSRPVHGESIRFFKSGRAPRLARPGSPANRRRDQGRRREPIPRSASSAQGRLAGRVRHVSLETSLEPCEMLLGRHELPRPLELELELSTVGARSDDTCLPSRSFVVASSSS